MEQREMRDIAIAWVVMSTAFSMTALNTPSLFPAFSEKFPIVLLTLGFGIALHEISHRWLANRYKYKVFYRLWLLGLALTLGTAIMTCGAFIFAAPGAVLVKGRRITLQHDGMIALIGPLASMFVGTLFLVVSLVTAPNTLLATAGGIGAYVNYFIAFVYLLPLPPLGGVKVLRWNFLAWLTVLAVAGYMAFLF